MKELIINGLKDFNDGIRYVVNFCLIIKLKV